MTEPNTNTPPEANPPAGEPNPPATPPQPDNALAAQLRIAQKELEKLRKAEEDRKKAEMTEVERLAAEANEAKQRLAQIERENLIVKAASKVGLPQELWNRIQGSTAEEIEADAQTLLGFVKAQPPAPAHTGQAPNNPPTPPQGNPEKEKIEGLIAEAQRKGNVAEMLRLRSQLAQIK